MTTRYKTIDLFAGIGGIRKGFDNAGFETVFSVDSDKFCKTTYDLNFKSSKLTTARMESIDINNLPDFDAMLGGFPCQSFSVAGSKKGFLDKGRGDLFFQIISILETLEKRKPRIVFLENVKHLKTHDGGRTFEVILNELKRIGYHVKHDVFNSSDYGNVPQNRERIYIVGFRDEAAYNAFEFPKKVERTKKLKDIFDEDVPEIYYYRRGWLYDRIKNSKMRPGQVYQWRRVYLREYKNKGLCCTLTANMGMGGHNVPLIKDHKGMRRLTPRECARLQGFPDTYRLPASIADSRLYKQIGNSVTISVIERIASKLKKALDIATAQALSLEDGRYVLKKKAQRNNVKNKVTEYLT